MWAGPSSSIELLTGLETSPTAASKGPNRQAKSRGPQIQEGAQSDTAAVNSLQRLTFPFRCTVPSGFGGHPGQTGRLAAIGGGRGDWGRAAIGGGR